MRFLTFLRSCRTFLFGDPNKGKDQKSSPENFEISQGDHSVAAGRDIIGSTIHTGDTHNSLLHINIGNSTFTHSETNNRNRSSRGDRPTEVIDKAINVELSRIVRSRMFAEFETREASLTFSQRLISGDLSAGSARIRGIAIAWCARLLTTQDALDKSRELLTLAESLVDCVEVDIANAFVLSASNDKASALNRLSELKTSASRTAALLVVSHHCGADGALNWIQSVGYECADFDADGKAALLGIQCKEGCWQDAKRAADNVKAEDIEDAPVLLLSIAMINLALAVPDEFRAVATSQPPFESLSFPLTSDSNGIDARRIATKHYRDLAQVARQLKCPKVASLGDEYALWLELRDPKYSELGMQKLSSKFRGSEFDLRFVPLGIQFGINLDPLAVEREIERQIALRGEISPDAAGARLALALTKKTPREVAEYIALHRTDLAKHIENRMLMLLEIEALSRSGMTSTAKEKLKSALNDGELGQEEARILRRIIAESDGVDPTQSRIKQYQESGKLRDLLILVDGLEEKGDWHNFANYGATLFSETLQVKDALRLARALSNICENERLVEIFSPHSDIRDHSPDLQMYYCWALYQEGELVCARTEMAKLSENDEDHNYRALLVNLGIAMGDWVGLSAFVAAELQTRDRRNAQELLGTAQLAHHLGSPHAKELTFEAASKGHSDPEVLAATYFLASTAGWEGENEVSTWIQRAAELSGDDGPIQQMSLKDIVDRKPDWDRRESETWDLLSRGEVPMFLAGQTLNKSLLNMLLFPALANFSEIDPRRRTAIPAYCGNRLSVSLADHPEAVGFDATALLTLSLLDLLDTTFETFDTIYLPHSTLGWLFEEKQRAAFHQPSRVRYAHNLRHFLATNVLERFAPSCAADSDLSAQVGDNFAALIAEAENVKEDDDRQKFVVRPAPVYRLGSLMDEEADLSNHYGSIISCLSVVEKLLLNGHISSQEAQNARAYLKVHEKNWPKPLEIPDNAILYLDDLAIDHFLHLKLLENIHNSGLKMIASPTEVAESDALIAYEDIADQTNDTIERIRATLEPRIKTGKVKLGRKRTFDELENQVVSNHPTISALALAEHCASVFIDDRCINQHAFTEENGVRAKILTTLDLLDMLVDAGSISKEENIQSRTKLRRAGYFFIPIRYDELSIHVGNAPILNSKLVETVELRAIRENLLRARMCDWLQLPQEANWLDSMFKVLTETLRNIWKKNEEHSNIVARANWILDQFDFRGWVHRLLPEVKEMITSTGKAPHIMALLTPPDDAPENIQEMYWDWLEEAVLKPLQEQFPEQYAWIIEESKSRVAEFVHQTSDYGDVA